MDRFDITTDFARASTGFKPAYGMEWMTDPISTAIKMPVRRGQMLL